MEKIKALQPITLKQTRILDPFWSNYMELVRTKVIPYQWEALNDRLPDTEPSHAVKNFMIAAGLADEEFHGRVFQDSDVAKWLEAVAYSLTTNPDPKLEATADGVIEIIEKAQQPDGYLNTYYTLKDPERRWTNLCECHELYCAGHMMEAAVAYFMATGKRKLLDVMSRYADYIDTVFGPEPGKIHGYDGHEEVELALVKLYGATGNEKYLNLGIYFIEERGKEPNFFELEWRETRDRHTHHNGQTNTPPELTYHQAHMPVADQEIAVGHAVRAVYLYSGIADVARETGNEKLLQACRKLFQNITGRQMYITGGIGSARQGEAFTFDYDLPNETVYAESCASVGLIFFAHRMLQLEVNSVYSDVIEKVLYNTILAAMSKDGSRFFYVNPLEVWPEASQKNPVRYHVKPVRQKWFVCACCPPNIARLLASLGQYIYSVNEDTVYAHLYIGGTADLKMNGIAVRLHQQSNYPWDGKVTFKVETRQENRFGLALRIPGWCGRWSVRINNMDAGREGELEKGYLILDRIWKDGDTVELSMDMTVEFIQANPLVRADSGKISIQRGPLVYCLEETDNGSNLSALSIPDLSQSGSICKEDWMGDIMCIRLKGFRTSGKGWENVLYRPAVCQEESVDLKAIPYYAWGNRTEGEMQVWVRRYC